MDRHDIIERIKARAKAVRALGATALYIYGSRVRGDERPDSDLDVFVDFDPDRFGFVELVELEEIYLPALVKLNPGAKPGDVVTLKIARVNAAFDELRLEPIN